MKNLFDIVLYLKNEIDTKTNNIYLLKNSNNFKLTKLIKFLDDILKTFDNSNNNELIIKNKKLFKLKLYSEYIEILKKINIVVQNKNIYRLNKKFVLLYTDADKNTYSNKHKTVVNFLDMYLKNLLSTTKDELFEILYHCEYITNFEYLLFVKDKNLSLKEKIENIKTYRKYLSVDKYFKIMFFFTKKEIQFKKNIKKTIDEFNILKYLGFQLYNLDFFGILYIDTSKNIKQIRKNIRRTESIIDIEEEFEKIKNTLLNMEINENKDENENEEINEFIKNYFLNKKHKKNQQIKTMYNKKYQINEIYNDWDYHHIIPLYYVIDNNEFKDFKTIISKKWKENKLNIDLKKEIMDMINNNLNELNNIYNIIYIKRKKHEEIHKKQLFIIDEINEEYIIFSDIDKKESLCLKNNIDCMYKTTKDNINKIKKTNENYKNKYLN